MPLPEFTIPPEVVQAVQLATAFLIAYFIAFSVSLGVWTYQDIKSRSRDTGTHIFAVLLVLVLNLPGLVLYLILRPSETLAQQYARSLEEEAILQDLEKESACPNCKREIQEDFIICPYCTTQLKHPCPSCGQPLQALWRACPYCTVPVATGVAVVTGNGATLTTGAPPVLGPAEVAAARLAPVTGPEPGPV